MTLRKELEVSDRDPVAVDNEVAQEVTDHDHDGEESQEEEGEATRQQQATFVISPPEEPEPEPDPESEPAPSAPPPWSFRRTPSAASDLESVSSYYMEMSRRVSSVCFGLSL